MWNIICFVLKQNKLYFTFREKGLGSTIANMFIEYSRVSLYVNIF